MRIFRVGLLEDETANAAISWSVLGLLVLAGLAHLASGTVLWAGLAAVVVAVVLVPPVADGDPRTMVGWQLTVIAAVPVFAGLLGVGGQAGTYVTIAALALLTAAELDAFTDVEMTDTFAVLFVVVVTMAVAGLWTIFQFTADVYFGTAALVDQTTLMWDLVAATVIGVAAGVAYALFLRETDTDGDARVDPQREPIPDVDSDRRSVPLVLARVAQVAVLGLTAYGGLLGSYDLLVNGALAFGLTLVPALIVRRYDYPIDPRLVLWIAVAALLHAIGFLGPYEAETGVLSMYDHLTHMITSAFVAGLGYAFLAALEYRTDRLNFPSGVRGLFTIVFILATGVAREIAEFAAGPIGSFLIGTEILTQHGIGDIVLDIFFNTFAAVLVALGGLGYFGDFVRVFSDRLARFRRP